MEKEIDKTNDSEPCRILGYEVIRNDNKESDIAYLLKGKWALYRLVRYNSRPEYMYALNSRGKICSIKGNCTFTDRDGKLELVLPIYKNR